MQEIESEGKTVSEAVENALKKIGLRRDQVEVVTLQESSSGFMGIGAKPARVKITEKKWVGQALPDSAPAKKAAPEKHTHRSPSPRAQKHEKPVISQPKEAPQATAEKPADVAADRSQVESLLKDLLDLLAIEQAKVSVDWDKKQERLTAVIDSPQAQRLIEGEGKPLEALQFLINLMLSRRSNGIHAAVQVDACGYWQKREKEILEQAERAINEVKNTGKSARLEPMDAATRRLVHKQLAGHPDVMTASEGDGLWRKIVIKPRHG